MFPSKSHRGWLPSAPWLATATGILAFGLLRSFKLISPSRVAWLFQFDAAQSYFGWLFYRHEPWTFPLGVVHSLGMEQSSSIVYTDSIPLLAVVLKVFSAALPPGFQYLGLWLCSCYALQGYFAFRLLSLFTRDRIALAVGTLLFLLNPVLLVRAQIHFGLTAQWIVVCALYLYYLPAERSRLRQWLLLLWLAPLIHAYLMFMAFVIWGAYLLRHMLADRGRSALRLAGWGLASVLGSLAVMWLVGYFVGDMDVSTWGFGFFSMNLLAPFAPNDIGPFLMPAFRTATFGQSDGFNYLGLGVLFGLLVVVGSQLSARRHAASEGHLPWLRKPDSALILCCIVLWLFALSNHITLGSNVIVKWPLSSALDRYANIFRSSGRLFWPVYYALLMLTVRGLAGLRGRKARILLLIVLIVQIADFFPYIQQVHASSVRLAKSRDIPTFDSTFWQQARARYPNIYVIPGVYGINQIPGTAGMNEFVRYEYLAFAYGFAIDSAYYARDMSATVQRERLSRHDAFARGQLDPHGIYLIQSVDIAKLQTIQSTFPPTTGIGVVDGFTVVAPEWFAQNGDHIGHWLHRPGDISHFDIMLDRDYLFAIHGDGLIYLSGGWSEPEADGTWSLGDMSQISFYLRPTPASARISLGLVPYLPAAYPRLELTVSVNRHESAHWIFERNKPFPATTLTIPTAWLAANGDNSIQLHFDRPRSPSEAGEGADTRQIAIQLRSMQLQQP